MLELMTFQEESWGSRFCPAMWVWREHSDGMTGRNYGVKKKEEKIKRKREVAAEWYQSKKSGFFIFWIDRSDGMEPCVTVKAAVLLARTFLAHTHTSTDILPIPSCKIHTLHTHGTHGGGSLHGQVRVSFTISSLCCRPGWSQTLISPWFFLYGAFAKGVVFSRPSRHGAI